MSGCCNGPPRATRTCSQSRFEGSLHFSCGLLFIVLLLLEAIPPNTQKPAQWTTWNVLSATADEYNNVYEPNEAVKVYANKIGPHNNPLETYGFFNMPGCPPRNWDKKYPTIGHALVGDEYYELNASIHFNVSTAYATVCTFTPTASDVRQWKEMVEARYWYQFIVDGLELRALLGKMSQPARAKEQHGDGTQAVPLIFTHRSFHLGTNGKQIVSASLKVSELKPVDIGKPLEFTYAVYFVPSTLSFRDRLAHSTYSNEEKLEHRVRWVAVANSFVLVIFLVGIVLLILSRTLRADFARMDEDQRRREEGREDLHDDAGWKQLYADVFRVPPAPTVLCSLAGIGVQLLVTLTLSAILGTVSTTFASSQHSRAVWIVIIYALGSVFSGYVSASHFQVYASLSSTMAPLWIKCALLTAFLYPGLVFVCGSIANTVALLYGSAEAVHLFGIFALLFMWLVVSLPLVVIGTLYGRHSNRRVLRANKHEQPHINQIPRLVPAIPSRWYQRRYFYPLCGLLPFGSIFIEIYLVFTSFWLYKFYYFYGFLLLVLIIFVFMTACVAVTATYLSLNAEDHRWQWQSVATGASSSAYIFAYAAYFYVWKTSMSGPYMFVFYFTYTTLLVITVAFVGGAVGFLSASRFVNNIYSRVKAD